MSTKHDLFSFKIFVSKFEGLKGRHFNGRPRAALSLAAPLAISHCFLTRSQVGQKGHYLNFGLQIFRCRAKIVMTA